MGLDKAAASREPARATPVPGERANGEAGPSAPEVDELLTSLVDAVEAPDEEEVQPTVEVPAGPVRLTAPRRPLIRKLRRARGLVRRDVAFYVLALATVALGIAIGLFAGRVLP
jgi:hypothetical protein